MIDPEKTLPPGRAPRWYEKLLPEVTTLRPWLYTSERVVLFSWLGKVWVLWKSKTLRR